VLRWFGIEPTPDMQGHDLADVLVVDEEVREAALFGIHGAHVNVTDGRYVYMRASKEKANVPLEDFTLMPTHMKSRRWRDSCHCCRPWVCFDFSACHSDRALNRCPRQCGDMRRQRGSVRPDTRRRLTKSSTFERAYRKSGARAADSPSCHGRHRRTRS
jgi:hypothetical protein